MMPRAVDSLTDCELEQFRQFLATQREGVAKAAADAKCDALIARVRSLVREDLSSVRHAVDKASEQCVAQGKEHVRDALGDLRYEVDRDADRRINCATGTTVGIVAAISFLALAFTLTLLSVVHTDAQKNAAQITALLQQLNATVSNSVNTSATSDELQFWRHTFDSAQSSAFTMAGILAGLIGIFICCSHLDLIATIKSTLALHVTQRAAIDDAQDKKLDAMRQSIDVLLQLVQQQQPAPQKSVDESTTCAAPASPS